MRGSGSVRGNTPRTRLLRRLGLERNELRRRVDRVQRVIALGLLVLLLGTAVPLAAWAASWSYEAGVRAEEAERENRRQVVATVTAIGGGSGGYVHETVRATWPGPDGEPRTGTLPGWRNAETGAQRRIWVDREGDPAAAPRLHSRTVTDASYAAAAAVLGCSVPVLAAYVLVRRRCDRHRDHLWDVAWARMDADANPRS
ncbi:hypothetical protein ACN3XK_43205 [Actinomadura welshii]